MDQGDYYYYSSVMKKSGQMQIPVFGNWDFSNDLPITQYFECARQAGLGRYSSSSSSIESDPRSGDLYSVQKAHPRGTAPVTAPASQKTKARERREKRCALVNNDEKYAEKKKVAVDRIYDVTQPQPKVRHMSHSKYKAPKAKAVDEDLYQIPPHLLNNRKKKLGFISRCLVPACSA